MNNDFAAKCSRILISDKGAKAPLYYRGILMHKVMVFIDYQNFNINLKKHYENKKEDFKGINYLKLKL